VGNAKIEAVFRFWQNGASDGFVAFSGQFSYILAHLLRFFDFLLRSAVSGEIILVFCKKL